VSFEQQRRAPRKKEICEDGKKKRRVSGCYGADIRVQVCGREKTDKNEAVSWPINLRIGSSSDRCCSALEKHKDSSRRSTGWFDLDVPNPQLWRQKKEALSPAPDALLILCFAFIRDFDTNRGNIVE
jgi:hypothetical protein